MDNIIEQILQIIGNYRADDEGQFFKKIDIAHIKNWVNQFNSEDREFILSELLHILPNSYLSKETTLRIFTSEFEILSRDLGYQNVTDFLEETRFLDCQEHEKSQKILLELIDSTLKEKYNYSLAECGNKQIKNWVYIDDVLASGRTFRDDITQEIDEFGRKKFEDSNITIIASFVILHSWALKNVPFTLDQTLGFKLGNRLKFYEVSRIDNYPRINYYNSSPKYNHVYPKKSEIGTEFLEYIENAFEHQYPMSNEEFAFRNPNFPAQEEFYSSPENRDRYETILLKKGIEIIKDIENLRAVSIRPLGMTPPSYKTLGTGSHTFTWRNISNTCPLVFWWGNNWIPLFYVKNRGH